MNQQTSATIDPTNRSVAETIADLRRDADWLESAGESARVARRMRDAARRLAELNKHTAAP
jgi:hypothetical protein